MARNALFRVSEMLHSCVGSKVTFQMCLALSIVILSHLTLTDASGIQKRESEEGVSVTPAAESQNSSTTNSTTTMGDDASSGNTAAVVAASVIAVVACIVIVLAVYIVKRRRQSRLMDKEKKMQIQMSSARNAGVYQDLTVSVPADEKPPASPEHERLKSAEDA